MLIANSSFRSIVVAVLGFVTVACAGSGISDSGDPTESPEDRGNFILANAFGDPSGNTELVWTRDGTEVAFVHPSDGLKAVNISSRSVRVLDPTPNIVTFARGSSGDWLYFAAALPNAPAGTPNVRISRVNPARAGSETIAMEFLGNNVLIVSPDERWIAFDNTLLDSRTSLSRELPFGHPFGFSQDGTRLLYRINGSPRESYVLFSTADGSSQQVVADNFVSSSFRWSGNSPQILVVQRTSTSSSNATTRISEFDGLTGVARELGQFSSNASSTGTWSQDGQTLGVWLQPTYRRSELTVIRAGAPPAMVLRVDADVGKPVFSPSATAVAYAVYTFSGSSSTTASLYVKSGI